MRAYLKGSEYVFILCTAVGKNEWTTPSSVLTEQIFLALKFPRKL